MTQTLTIPQLIELALQHHQAGELPQAENLYRQVLQVQPTHADAWHLLGVLAHQVKNYPVAVELMRKAITLNSAAPTFYNNLGNALREQGKLIEAVHCFQRALSLDPKFAQAYHNLGCTFRDQNNLAEAEACYQQALALNPNYLNAYNNLAAVLVQQEKLTEAAACCQRALNLAPDSADAYNTLGNVFREQNKATEAFACYQRALELEPNFPEVLNNLGNVLKDQGKLSEAVAYFQRALALNPNLVEAYNNLGSTWKEQGMVDEAIGCYRRSLAMKPRADIHSRLLFNLNYLAEVDSATVFSEYQRFEAQYAAPLASSIQALLNNRDPHRRLKIGYVSPDFRQHAVAYFIEPIFAHHDHSQFEIFGYYNHSTTDEVTQRLQSYTDHWRNCATLSDELLAKQIREDQIDILVDLAGHSAGNRLLVFARKPAPVQVTYLGYPNTTGMRTIDYHLTDGYTDPEGIAEKFSSETLVRLPTSYFCYQPPLETLKTPLPPSPVLHNGYLTFGSFNYYAKLSTKILACWAQLLHAVPGSKLLVKTISLNDVATRQTCQARFAKLGVPSDRLILITEATALHEHLAIYHQVDIALDSFPYNGATTTCETLWMGVPVVTLVGERHVSRMGLSILSTIGLTELIAYTEEEYIQICLKLANDTGYLQDLRATLRERMQSSPLMDAATFTRYLEKSYRQFCPNQNTTY
jgi:predicted O-linked N-acetylglucosamine transferase (SPINDLY family)